MNGAPDRLSITVVGAGVLGVWQAYELARRGHRITLREAAPEHATGAASRIAGAMLAPYCEAEAAQTDITTLGLRGLARWREVWPELPARGTLVVASARDTGERERFSRMTDGHRHIGSAEIATLEPELAERFACALYYPDEAHMPPRLGLSLMIARLRQLDVGICFGAPVCEPLWMAAAAGDIVIDCRGIAARCDLPALRGVRGEMAIVRADTVQLSRPIRLLHPRSPTYVVPWGDATYMIGATMIESSCAGHVSVRSALELLGAATAIHPGFADARIVELSAGVRPAYDDNLPKLVWRGRCLSVDGAYRHGFLLAPALAGIVADHLETGSRLPDLLTGATTLPPDDRLHLGPMPPRPQLHGSSTTQSE